LICQHHFYPLTQLLPLALQLRINRQLLDENKKTYKGVLRLTMVCGGLRICQFIQLCNYAGNFLF
jgi:hypothetical protein